MRDIRFLHPVHPRKQPMMRLLLPSANGLALPALGGIRLRISTSISVLVLFLVSPESGQAAISAALFLGRAVLGDFITLLFWFRGFHGVSYSGSFGKRDLAMCCILDRNVSCY